jgi:hypothetical protein
MLVMAGLVPAIHGLPRNPAQKNVDARDKPVHDGECRGDTAITKLRWNSW